MISAPMHVRPFVVTLGLISGCGDDDCCKVAPDGGMGDGLTEVAQVRGTARRDVDILFVVDDSPATAELQTVLRNGIPAFVDMLDDYMGGLPNLHLGIVTPDLGTKGSEDAVAGPPIGSGVGSCAGTGKAGALQTNGIALVGGSYIADTGNGEVTRSRNYSGTLASTFSAMAALGSVGCGFEQPIEAMKVALANTSTNAGFRRVDATLAVILVVDEDDCSFAHSTLLGGDTTTLGPLGSFRCTRFGVTCDDGGATPDEMSTVGTKGRCHSNESSPYLTRVADYVPYLESLVQSPRDLYVGAIAAPASPIAIELRTPPGGGTGVPALAHTCTGAGGIADPAGDPAVRLADFVSSFDRYTFAGEACASDLTAAEQEIARQIRLMNGDRCLVHELPSPAECVAVEISGDVATPVPPCEAGAAEPCFRIVTDSSNCASAQHQRLDVVRSDTPDPASVVTLRCKL